LTTEAAYRVLLIAEVALAAIIAPLTERHTVGQLILKLYTERVLWTVPRLAGGYCAIAPFAGAITEPRLSTLDAGAALIADLLAASQREQKEEIEKD